MSDEPESRNQAFDTTLDEVLPDDLQEAVESSTDETRNNADHWFNDDYTFFELVSESVYEDIARNEIQQYTDELATG